MHVFLKMCMHFQRTTLQVATVDAWTDTQGSKQVRARQGQSHSGCQCVSMLRYTYWRMLLGHSKVCQALNTMATIFMREHDALPFQSAIECLRVAAMHSPKRPLKTAAGRGQAAGQPHQTQLVHTVMKVSTLAAAEALPEAHARRTEYLAGVALHEQTT